MKRKSSRECLSCGILTLQVDGGYADEMAAQLRERWGVPVAEMEKPGSDSVWLDAYFETDVQAYLASRSMGRPEGVRAVTVRNCSGRDWQAFWQNHFRRFDVGRSLQVCPVWDDGPPPPRGRRRIRINPGMGFGTGEHFSTRFCLESVEALCRRHKPESFLDIGTGSGILAIAAVKMGVARVIAVDNDAMALDDALAHARLNRVSKEIRLLPLDITAEPIPWRCDLVCANLFATLLVAQAEALTKAARHHIVLSGIREQEVDEVAGAFSARGGREVVRDADGEWCGLVFDVKAASSRKNANRS